MNRIALLFLIFFSLPIFPGKSQNKSPVYPRENFFVVQAKLADGRPMIGSLNISYKNYDKKSQYPWCITINIALDLKHVTKDGLPERSESSVAYSLEDELLKNMRKITTVHYIGHIFNDGFLDIYAYTDDPEKLNPYLQQAVNKKGLTRGFAYKMEKDAGWMTVKAFFK